MTTNTKTFSNNKTGYKKIDIWAEEKFAHSVLKTLIILTIKT